MIVSEPLTFFLPLIIYQKWRFNLRGVGCGLQYLNTQETNSINNEVYRTIDFKYNELEAKISKLEDKIMNLELTFEDNIIESENSIN